MVRALLLDFYGTLVAEDDALVTHIAERVASASRRGVRAAQVATHWHRRFAETCAAAHGPAFRTQREIELESLADAARRPRRGRRRCRARRRDVRVLGCAYSARGRRRISAQLPGSDLRGLEHRRGGVARRDRRTRLGVRARRHERATVVPTSRVAEMFRAALDCSAARRRRSCTSATRSAPTSSARGVLGIDVAG